MLHASEIEGADMAADIVVDKLEERTCSELVKVPPEFHACYTLMDKS